jgi:hypothetical protein
MHRSGTSVNTYIQMSTLTLSVITQTQAQERHVEGALTVATDTQPPVQPARKARPNKGSSAADNSSATIILGTSGNTLGLLPL